MFNACRPEACRNVYRSGHSFSLDDEARLNYDVTASLSIPADGDAAPQAATSKSAPAIAAESGGLFQACSKPAVAADAELEAGPPLAGDASLDLRHGTISAPVISATAKPTATTTATSVTVAPLEDPGYDQLDGDSDDEDFAERTKTFVRRFSEVNKTINTLQLMVSVLLLVAVLLTICLCYLAYKQLIPEEQTQAREITMLASIPIVACVFTWFHIWMAIQMMFRPLKFFGLYNHRETGMGVGWQGVVPRKARRMATMGYSCARPYIQGPREIMDSVDPRALVTKIRPQLTTVIEGALSRVGAEHYPWIDKQMGANGKKKIASASVDRILETCPELWRDYTELLSDKTHGIDNDGMFVKVFTENKELLNNFFLSLGEKEFRFIEHCGAAMGFLCGLIQLVAFNNLSGLTRTIFLPTTGFFLGIFSNWLAIQMVFKPTFPIPVRIFGFHVYDIQGLFLKRQMDVCALYSKMVVDNFLNFDKIVEYMMSQPELWGRLKASYLAFNTKVMRDSLGSLATWLAPLALGPKSYGELENAMKMALVQGLYEAKDIHKVAGKYVGKVTNLERKNCVALQRMPPDEFENLLHPIFQEDEWILVLLGGVLGVIVGMGQIYFLSN
mmetsp:Transcript_11079/g.24410  ORF Transcript_11079/g.24410 Transcript_11079/m.24410 type:complete len:616 (-) Transcript_11079:93-1940(-)